MDRSMESVIEDLNLIFGFRGIRNYALEQFLCVF